MSLEEATERMRAAIEAQDLDQLSQALGARAAALATSAKPDLPAIEAGERALFALVALKRRLAFRSARLTQLQTAVAGALAARTRPHIDCKG